MADDGMRLLVGTGKIARAVAEDEAALRKLAETIAYVDTRPLADVVARLEKALHEPVTKPLNKTGP